MPSAVKLDRPGVIPFREGGAATMTENEALARLLQKVENAWLEQNGIPACVTYRYAGPRASEEGVNQCGGQDKALSGTVAASQ